MSTVPTKVFLLQDESELTNKLKSYLSQIGIELETRTDIEEAYHSILDGEIKCVIIDADELNDHGLLLNAIHIFQSIPIIVLSSSFMELTDATVNGTKVYGLPNGATVEQIAELLLSQITIPNKLRMIKTKIEYAEKYMRGEVDESVYTVLEFKEFPEFSTEATRKYANNKSLRPTAAAKTA